MSHRISVRIMEIIMQLAMGRYIRQFLPPNCRSPGNLNRPTRPSNTISAPSTTIAIPAKSNHLPICCGPKSIIPCCQRSFQSIIAALSPLRKQGSRNFRVSLDSRLRGNDRRQNLFSSHTLSQSHYDLRQRQEETVARGPPAALSSRLLLGKPDAGQTI